MKPSSPSRKHWAAMNEFSFIGGIRLLFWICKVFGRWPFRVILYPVLIWYVLAKPAARHASQLYLRHVSQKQPIATGLLGVLRHFAAFAEMMLDKMLLWSGQFKLESVQIIGIEPVRKMAREKRGGVLLCSHFGNLDLCRILSNKDTSLKTTILVHTRHAEAFNQMLASLNPDSQMNLLQVTEITPATAMILSQRIEQGEFVVIAGDRIPVSPDPRVVMSEFLGEMAPFPVGPYILASVLQCPIFMLFSMRRQSGAYSYEIHFKLLRESLRLPRKNREQQLAEVVADYAQQLEQHTLNSPLQWFNFYDYWHLPHRNDTDAKH